MSKLSQLAIFLSIGLELLFLLKLCYARLISQYRWLALMLAIGVVRDVFLDLMNAHTDVYRALWIITLIPYVAAQIGVAAAAYFRLARLYTGIGRFAGWLYLCGVSIAITACVVVDQLVAETQYGPYVDVGLILERSTALVLSGATVLVLAFLARFPSPLQKMPRNLVVHMACLTTFFGLTAVAQVVLGSLSDEPTSRIMEGIFFFLGDICYYVWMKKLSSKGESVRTWPDMKPSVAANVRRLDAELVQFAKRIKVSGGA